MKRCHAAFSLAALASAGLLAAGCSNGPKVVDERSEVVRAFSPEWYQASPRDEEGTVRKTAQAVGAKPRISESFAINQARQAMALAIESRVDVLQRAFTEQVESPEDPEVLERFQDANNVIASTTLRGSHVVRKETYREPDGQYRTFVLMELDAADLDKNYIDAMRELGLLETRLRSGESWAELEQRARELREEREQGGGVGPVTDEQIMGSLGEGGGSGENGDE